MQFNGTEALTLLLLDRDKISTADRRTGVALSDSMCIRNAGNKSPGSQGLSVQRATVPLTTSTRHNVQAKKMTFV